MITRRAALFFFEGRKEKEIPGDPVLIMIPWCGGVDVLKGDAVKNGCAQVAAQRSPAI